MHTHSRMVELLRESWWVLAARGGLALAFGIFALIVPGATLIALVLLFAAYALAVGGASIVGAIKHRHSDRAWRTMLALGVVSFLAGALTLIIPGMTVLLFVMLMAVNAVAVGILDIVLAIRLRKRVRREWLLALAGALSVAFGVLVFVIPAAGVAALVLLVSVYAVVTGGLLLALGLRARKWQSHNGEHHDAPPLPAA